MPAIHIITHGHCNDGLFAAYTASRFYKDYEVRYSFVSPSDSRSWPKPVAEEYMFLDVTFPLEDMLRFRSVATALTIIDHHPHTDEFMEEFGDQTFDSSCCAAVLTHRHFFPDEPVPEVLESVNRVDLWLAPTETDLIYRELFHDIAHQAPSNPNAAFANLSTLLTNLATPTFAAIPLALGIASLGKKRLDIEICHQRCPHKIVTMEGPDDLEEFGVPPSWIGKKVMVMDTTLVKSMGLYFDSSLAGDHFIKTQGIDVFINYYKVSWIKQGTSHYKIVYHARSVSTDLTECDVLEGHPSAAGGQHEFKGEPLPFVI
uniref:DHH family protein n=1 Tax=viral metagenome TaxID=1070528 RepID=A0A6C0AQY5_9ZZZZ